MMKYSQSEQLAKEYFTIDNKTNFLVQMNTRKQHEILGMMIGMLHLQISRIETKSQTIQKMKKTISTYREKRTNQMIQINETFSEMFPDYKMKLEKNMKKRKEIKKQEEEIQKQKELQRKQQMKRMEPIPQVVIKRQPQIQQIQQIQMNDPLEIVNQQKRMKTAEELEKEKIQQKEDEEKRKQNAIQLAIERQQRAEELKRKKIQEEQETKKREEQERKEREELERKKHREEYYKMEEIKNNLMRQPFTKKTMDQIQQGFVSKCYSGEEFMNYCKLALREKIPFATAKMLYFFNCQDVSPTSNYIFDSIKSKTNVLIIIRTSNELFCIHFNEQIPKDHPQRKPKGSKYYENTFLKYKEVYMYVIYHKKEMYQPPKRIQHWKGISRVPQETIKFKENKALMEFKNVFEIVSVKDAGYWFDIQFKSQATLYDEYERAFSFDDFDNNIPVQQIVVCELSND